MKSTAISNGVLIIGYGNCLRGDDGVGWAAGELLDLPVYDHVIIAGDRFTSFATRGLL